MTSRPGNKRMGLRLLEHRSLEERPCDVEIQIWGMRVGDWKLEEGVLLKIQEIREGASWSWDPCRGVLLSWCVCEGQIRDWSWESTKRRLKPFATAREKSFCWDMLIEKVSKQEGTNLRHYHHEYRPIFQCPQYWHSLRRSQLEKETWNLRNLQAQHHKA